MRLLARFPVLILAAALCAIPAFAQNGPPAGGDGRAAGIAEIAAHGVQGTVTTISGGDFTVKTEDGASYKIETGVNTRFRKQREQITAADIHIGDMVGAFGDKDEKAKTLGAIAVMVFDKAQFEKARADFGKTWTAGAIQFIDETKITVKRPDNVIQTLVVDENTSFRKHRESITLADIKVGDNITARGALQGANFLATELNVGGPGGGFRDGRGAGGGPGGPDHGTAPNGPANGAASGQSGTPPQTARTPQSR